MHAGEQVTVGDAGGGEEAVVTLDEVVDGEDAVEVVALVDGLLAFAIVAGPQASELLASHALECSGGDHALGRATDADEDVGASVGPGGRDGAGDITVGDETDPSAGFAPRVCGRRVGHGRG